MTEPSENPEIRPPAHLSRPEKRAFLATIKSKKAAGATISDAFVDLVADLVTTRSRIVELTRIWRAAVRDNDGYLPSEKHLIALTRQLDATTALSRRLARELDAPAEHQGHPR